MPTYALTVGGTAVGITPGTLRISETLNGRNTMSFEVHSVNGTFRAEWGDEVIYTEDGTRLFAGFVDAPAEQGLFSTGGTPIANRIQAMDYNSLTDRRIVDVVIPTGTLKAALQVLDDYLTPYGVTLDAGQVNGPTLSEITFHVITLTECLNQLSTLTGYFWEITYNKVLRMVLPGSSTAPFHVVPASDPSVSLGDIAAETVREEYANRVFVLAGTGTKDVSESFVGDGANRTFSLYAPVAGYPSVSVNGTPVTLGINGVDTEYEWTFHRTFNAVVQLAEAPTGTFHSALTGSDTLDVDYAGNHPFGKQADDAAEQALQGLWEVAIWEPSVFDPTIAQELADAYLDRRVTAFKKVTYLTGRSGILPGQTQTITVPDRDLSGTFLVTDVETVDLTNVFRRTVTAIGGTTIRGSWRDLYREWGRNTSGGTSSAVVISNPSGPQLGSPAFLGGSRNTSIAKAPAAWTPVVDYVPFTALSSFAARVRAQIFTRNAGITVTARLWNVTDSAAVATSSGVTSTTSTEVTFLGSLVAGKTYRLEILSSASGEGVYGIGVLESA